MKRLQILLAAMLAITTAIAATAAEDPSVDAVLSAVVALKAGIPENARTAESLGTERSGHGVVIDSDGLVLTIGYLILEAESVTVTAGDGKTVPARVVAYDHASGFGLVRTAAPLPVQPMPLADSAKSKPGDVAMVAGAGGFESAMPARIVSRRAFAGYWEYLLEDAIFTYPAYPVFGGAALIDTEGSLIGIGSLFVNDAAGPEIYSPGNMFVPVNLLKPILADMLATGGANTPRKPWLGLYAAPTERGLFVRRVAYGGPAQMAGVVPGILVLGVEGRPVDGLEDFYRKVWALGEPGVTVHLTVLDIDGEPHEIAIVSADRLDWLRHDPGAN